MNTMDITQVIDNFVDEQDCAQMIFRLNELEANGNVIVRDDGRIGVINQDDEIFLQFVEKYKQKTINMFNDGFNNFSGYIATKYNVGIGMTTHIDSDPGVEMGALMYLNDDYEGGELTYTDPNGVFHSIKPKAGSMVYCPSWYAHGVNAVTSGVRYFFTVSLDNLNK
jgi:hypothetical protein